MELVDCFIDIFTYVAHLARKQVQPSTTSGPEGQTLSLLKDYFRVNFRHLTPACAKRARACFVNW